MQGLFIRNGAGSDLRRPKSKKEVKELAAAARTNDIIIERTALLGNSEYGGPLDLAPAGRITFCGPDPYHRRSFYGTIDVRHDGEVVVK